MKKRIFSLILALCAMLALCIPAAAAPSDGDPVSIPVYLTVIHTTKNINVTLPASMPISKVDDTVLTADNLRIINNSDTQGVRVTSVTVTGIGDYGIASYSDFNDQTLNRIALSINGCGTAEDGGALELGDAFPDIAAGAYIPVRYDAKVSATGEVNAVSAAQVIFTLTAID